MEWMKNIVLYVIKHNWLNWTIKLCFALGFVALGLGLALGLNNYWYLIFAIFGFSSLAVFVFKEKKWKYYKQNHGIVAVIKEIHQDRKMRKIQDEKKEGK